MWSLILSIFSAVVLLLSCGFCIWFSYRRGLFNTALRFGCFLLGGLISFVLAKLLAPVIAASVLPLLTESLDEATLQILSLPTLQELLVKLAAGIVAPLFFVIVFFLVEKLTFFIYVPLKKKFANNEKLHGMKHDKLYGALLGIALAIITTITWLMPFSGYTYFAGETIATLSKVEVLELPDETVELSNEFAASPIAKIDHAVTGWLFRSLSSDLHKVVNVMASFVEVADSITEDIPSGTIPVDKITEVLTSSKEAATITIGLVRDILPTVVPTDNPVVSKIVSSVSDGLDKLLAAQQSMSDEEFQKEISAVSNVLTLMQNSDDVSTTAVVKTVLESKYISEAIAAQEDLILQELGGETIDLSKSEKQELQKLINEYEGSAEVKNLITKIFGLK